MLGAVFCGFGVGFVFFQSRGDDHLGDLVVVVGEDPGQIKCRVGIIDGVGVSVGGSVGVDGSAVLCRGVENRRADFNPVGGLLHADALYL